MALGQHWTAPKINLLMRKLNARTAMRSARKVARGHPTKSATNASTFSRVLNVSLNVLLPPNMLMRVVCAIHVTRSATDVLGHQVVNASSAITLATIMLAWKIALQILCLMAPSAFLVMKSALMDALALARLHAFIARTFP